MTDIKVEVAYALPEKQKIVALSVPQGTTALEAVQQSAIWQYFEGLDESAVLELPMGIFGKGLDGKVMAAPDQYQMLEHDRVELYRPLILDPKAARALRAERARAKKAKQAAPDEVKEDASE